MIKTNDMEGLQTILQQQRIEEINELTGKYYKGEELEITYKSPVDMQIQMIRDEQFNPLTLAIVRNNLPAVQFLTKQLDTNLFYSTCKPGSYDFSDTCQLRNQIFPITYTIINEYFDMF